MRSITIQRADVHLRLCSAGEPCHCEGAESGRAVERVTHLDTAVTLLQRLRGDEPSMGRLRNLLEEFVPPPSVRSLSDHQVISDLATLLQQGRVQLVDCRPMPLYYIAPEGQGTVEPTNVFTPSQLRGPKEKEVLDWIEIQLLDEASKPIANQAYRIKLPDGSIRSGKLDKQGLARVDDIPGGMCEVSFTEIDGREWKAA